MGTINSAFSLISQGLDADQAALSVVANNVANASTPGYTEEIPDWQENQPININGVSYGDGVTETGSTSVRDSVLNERLDQQQQLASASSARLTALNTVQVLFTPDSGSSSSTAGDIGSDLTGFFSSLSSLEANPTDNSLRQNVLSTASTQPSEFSHQRHRPIEPANHVNFARFRCGHARGSAPAGHEPAFAVGRNQ